MLAEVREKSLAIYLRVVASLVPRHLAIQTIGDEFDDMTTTELRQYLAEQARELGLLDLKIGTAIEAIAIRELFSQWQSIP